MSRAVRVFGTDVYRLGVITHHDLDGLTNLDLGSEASILAIGEATAGEPQATAATPVVHEFTDPADMIAYFVGGNLAEQARCLFDPAKAGQTSEGVRIQGAKVVYAIKVNQSTQASFTVNDGAAHNAVTFKDRLWGAKGNQTWFKLEVSGTGLQLTCGRDVAPSIGEHDGDQTFSITGVDEWISVTYSGAAATATMTFDGTTFTTTTAAGLDDLSIVATGKTTQELVDLINAAVSGDYTAVLLRPDRADTLSTYLDQFTAVNIKNPVIGKAEGSAWDIVEWCNSNSPYVEATWVAGYEPQVYTKTYLAGGALGGTTEAAPTIRISDALKVASRFAPRVVVSGFNGDVADEAAGTTVLSTINDAFAVHAAKCNGVGVPCERQVIIANNDVTKAAAYAAVSAFNEDYLACVVHEVYREDENNTREWLGAHCAAAMAGAMIVGSPVATPLSHRYIKASDIRPVCVDFDPATNLDYKNAVKNGLLFLETIPGSGYRWAKGISTYVATDNDARTALETVEARIRHKVIMRRALENFIGAKGKGAVSANEVREVILDAHHALADLTSPDFILVPGTDENGDYLPAYRSIVVTLSGNIVYVRGEVTFTTGINWIINDFTATLPFAVVG